MRRTLLRLLLAVCMLLAGAAQATGLDVSTGRVDALPAVQWCSSPGAFKPGTPVPMTCDWRALTRRDLARGFDARTFWLRLQLDNPSDEPLRRWIEVGNPRMELRTGYTDDNGRWERQTCGAATPRAQRAGVGCTQGLLELRLLPHSSRMLWVEVGSRTAVDLDTTVWDPDVQYKTLQRKRFMATLAFGTLLMAMLLSLLAVIWLRELAFAAFALAMGGELLLQMAYGGYLQRLFWPAASAMPLGVIPFSVLLTMTGFERFANSFCPSVAHMRRQHPVLRVPSVLLVGALAWSMLVDYRAGTRVWMLVLIAVVALYLTLLLQARLRGEQQAGELLLSLLPMMLLEGLRLANIEAWLPQKAFDANWEAWSIVLTTPLLLTSLARQSRRQFAALQKLQLVNQSRVEFLAQMGHELRSPLATVLSTARLLQHDPTPTLLARGLHDIQDSGERLLAMIDEILDHARGLAGQLGLRSAPVDWNGFVAGLQRQGQRLAAAQGNRFHLLRTGDAADWLAFDARRLRQVVDNLLRNAAQHTRDGVITLSLDLQDLSREPARKRLDIGVADTGSGMSDDELIRAFQPFRRGVNQVGQGLGLGLTIARQLVEAMGGQLRVHSEPGRGTRFDFSLEVDVGAPQTAAPAQTAATDRVAAPPAAPTSPSPPAPNAQTRERLRQLLDGGMLSAILALCDEIEQTHPAHADWAAAVRDAARLLDLEALAGLAR